MADKFRLAFRVAGDQRVPLAARAVPVGLVLYLALPIDIIPDFIPIVGHLDDVLILLVAGGLLLRLVPRNGVEELVTTLETQQARTPKGERRRAAQRAIDSAHEYLAAAVVLEW